MVKKEEEKYSLEDYLVYRDLLETSSSENSDKVIFNDSFVHAAMVLAYILDKAIKGDVRDINMYCGKFSLFRDSAKNALAKQRARVKPADDDENRMEQWKSFDPYKLLIEKLSDYFGKEGYMKVIIESEISEIVNEGIWTHIEKYVKNNQLKFYKLGLPLGLNHFVVAGNSYRQENDDKEKTALCCFNDEVKCARLRKNFKVLNLLSNPYSI